MAMDAAATQTVSGRVQQWIVNPNGEVDGLLLADGTQVAFPPHLSASLTQAVKLQETVQVTGWRAPGLPANAAVMRAQSIKSASGATVADQPPGEGALPAPPTPRAESALQAMSASGKIARVLYTDRGDANGVMLSSGPIVRFAPHIGAALADKLKPGATLYASGYGSRSAFGSALEATRIGSSTETAVDVFVGPGGPAGGAARARPPAGPEAMRDPARAGIRPPAGMPPPPAAAVQPPLPSSAQ